MDAEAIFMQCLPKLMSEWLKELIMRQKARFLRECCAIFDIACLALLVNPSLPWRVERVFTVVGPFFYEENRPSVCIMDSLGFLPLGSPIEKVPSKCYLRTYLPWIDWECTGILHQAFGQKDKCDPFHFAPMVDKTGAEIEHSSAEWWLVNRPTQVKTRK